MDNGPENLRQDKKSENIFVRFPLKAVFNIEAGEIYTKTAPRKLV